MPKNRVATRDATWQSTRRRDVGGGADRLGTPGPTPCATGRGGPREHEERPCEETGRRLPPARIETARERQTQPSTWCVSSRDGGELKGIRPPTT